MAVPKYIAVQGEEVLTAAPDLEGLKASLASMTRLRTLMNVDVYKLDRTWRPTVRVDFGDELIDAPLPKADEILADKLEQRVRAEFSRHEANLVEFRRASKHQIVIRIYHDFKQWTFAVGAPADLLSKQEDIDEWLYDRIVNVELRRVFKSPDEDREWCTINEHRWRIPRGHVEPQESAHCVRCGESYSSAASAPFKSSICTGRRVKS